MYSNNCLVLLNLSKQQKKDLSAILNVQKHCQLHENYMLWNCISWHDNVCTDSFVHMHSSTFVHLCGCTCVFASECVHIHARRARLVFD